MFVCDAKLNYSQVIKPYQFRCKHLDRYSLNADIRCMYTFARGSDSAHKSCAARRLRPKKLRQRASTTGATSAQTPLGQNATAATDQRTHESCDFSTRIASDDCLNRPSFSQLYSFPSERFHVLLNSLFKVLCNFPSRYLFAIGLTVIFSLR